MFFRTTLTKWIAAAAAALVVAVGVFGIVSATSSNGSSTASAATTSQVGSSASVGRPGLGGGGSNARSGPAAGGSSGKVTSASASAFTPGQLDGPRLSRNATRAEAECRFLCASPAKQQREERSGRTAPHRPLRLPALVWSCAIAPRSRQAARLAFRIRHLLRLTAENQVALARLAPSTGVA